MKSDFVGVVTPAGVAPSVPLGAPAPDPASPLDPPARTYTYLFPSTGAVLLWSSEPDPAARFSGKLSPSQVAAAKQVVASASASPAITTGAAVAAAIPIPLCSLIINPPKSAGGGTAMYAESLVSCLNSSAVYVNPRLYYDATSTLLATVATWSSASALDLTAWRFNCFPYAAGYLIYRNTTYASVQNLAGVRFPIDSSSFPPAIAGRPVAC